MQVFSDRRFRKVVEVTIYTVNLIAIIKLCLKLYEKLVILTAIYQLESSDYSKKREIIKYSIEVIFTIILLCYYTIFSFNINIIDRVMAAYIIISLYIIFELEFSYIFIVGLIIGLQSFIDRS